MTSPAAGLRDHLAGQLAHGLYPQCMAQGWLRRNQGRPVELAPHKNVQSNCCQQSPGSCGRSFAGASDSLLTAFDARRLGGTLASGLGRLSMPKLLCRPLNDLSKVQFGQQPLRRVALEEESQ